MGEFLPKSGQLKGKSSLLAHLGSIGNRRGSARESGNVSNVDILRWQSTLQQDGPQFHPQIPLRRPKIWEVTFGVPTRMDINPKEHLTKFIQEGPVKEWFAGAKVLEEIGCAMSFYSPILHPADGNIVVLGDSASFQEVENQEL